MDSLLIATDANVIRKSSRNHDLLASQSYNIAQSVLMIRVDVSSTELAAAKDCPTQVHQTSDRFAQSSVSVLARRRG